MADATGVIRPYGIVVSGRLELGLEIVREGGAITEIRPHTGIPEPFVASVPFVNAHSHLEYRGLQGVIQEREFWPWIREITRLKATQQLEDVRSDAAKAARENRASGVKLIGEHVDRPVCAAPMADTGLEGWIFQELITFFETESPEEKRRAVSDRLKKCLTVAGVSDRFQGVVIPHALYTVDRRTLEQIGQGGGKLSMHLAESRDESAFTRDGSGPIADFYRRHGVRFAPSGMSAFRTAVSLDLVREGAQLVHCCDLSDDEVGRLAESGATVVHCPRSNVALGCPATPVREMLEAGVPVGLGMDSAASAGPIDIFAEMRSALDVARDRGRPLSGEQVWSMATNLGARSLWRENWDLSAGWEGPLIGIRVPGAHTIDEVIASGRPGLVEWLQKS